MRYVEIGNASSYAVVMNEPQPDAELYDQFRAGLQSAFDRLYRKHADVLYSFITARCHPPLDVDNIFQETWTAAWRSRDRFQHQNFRAWLITIAANKIKDAIRSLKSRPGNVSIDQIEHDPAAKESHRDPETESLRLCLEQIEPLFAEVLKMKLEDELKDREIADQLGISPGTVASRAARGRKELKDCIEKRRIQE